jgi:hypothetical protein
MQLCKDNDKINNKKVREAVMILRYSKYARIKSQLVDRPL